MTKRSPKADGDTERVLDDLLALPPQEFTAARNAAAKQLLANGRREAAAAIKSLSRPPVSVWLMNQLAREQPKLISAFLAAAEDLREAYRSGGDIRAATAPQREAEARVVTAAVELARERGASVTDTVARGLRQTLDAAAADAGVAGALSHGRLLQEPDAPSLDALLESLPEPSTRGRSKTESHKRRALEEKIAETEPEAARARKAASAARRDLEGAQALAERTQKQAAAAEQHLNDLRQRLARLSP